jgi:4-amino-4-deoxy-L-arabinose transferase-like glycosyltransferase
MPTAVRPSFSLAGACLLLHVLANGQYGIFRDELYYIVCGDHPAWGYVDHPSVVPLLASWSHAIFGEWLTGFRLLPALVLSVTVGLTVEFTRALGGQRYARWLAGVCALLAPIFLLQGVLFISDLFQPLSWLTLSWVLVRLAQSRDKRWWLAFGAIAGSVSTRSFWSLSMCWRWSSVSP